MAVILTDSGIIRESIIKFDENISQEQVDDLTVIFKSKLVGKSLDEINIPIEEFITAEMKTGIEIIKKIIKEINKLLKETGGKFYLEGTNSVVDMPEFQNTDIGEESEKEELKNFSLITSNHLIEGKDIGTIGIIGPTRMDYSKVITVMKYISKKLNDDFKKGKNYS